MMVLLATPDILRELQGWENDGRRLEFVQDGSGAHVVGLEVLQNEYYAPIFDKLNSLERIEYTPHQQTD